MIFLTSTLTVILISAAVFLFVILLLVVMLLYARYKLTPQGDVTLKVNDKDYTVSPGTTILNTLSNNDIFLPHHLSQLPKPPILTARLGVQQGVMPRHIALMVWTTVAAVATT